MAPRAASSQQEEEVATECGVVASVVIELVTCRQPQVDYISRLQLQDEGVSHELKVGLMGHLCVDHDLMAVLRHFNSHDATEVPVGGELEVVDAFIWCSEVT